MIDSRRNSQVLHRLRWFITHNYPTQAECAKHMGISSQTLNGLLHGRHPFSEMTLRRLHAAGCEIEWLLIGRRREHRMSFTTRRALRSKILAELRSISRLLSFLDLRADDPSRLHAMQPTVADVASAINAKLSSTISLVAYGADVARVDVDTGHVTRAAAVRRRLLLIRLSQSEIARRLHVSRQAVSYALEGCSSTLLHRIESVISPGEKKAVSEASRISSKTRLEAPKGGVDSSHHRGGQQ